MKLLELLDTDPLAKMALIGFATVIVVTLGVFGFLLTRASGRKNGTNAK